MTDKKVVSITGGKVSSSQDKESEKDEWNRLALAEALAEAGKLMDNKNEPVGAFAIVICVDVADGDGDKSLFWDATNAGACAGSHVVGMIDWLKVKARNRYLPLIEDEK